MKARDPLLWLVLGAVACAAPANESRVEGAEFDPAARGKADAPAAVVYSSTSTIEELAGDDGPDPSDLGAIEPAYRHGGGIPGHLYLNKMSALGYYGPLGPYGPLGIVGPLGGHPWNADLYVTGSFSWSNWAEELTDSGGPLSANGPLGSTGPLNPEFWTSREDDWGGGFVSHLEPGGLFAPLGPVGVSGALGPLGPLGPIGAHGYERRDGGAYWPDEGEHCYHVPEGRETPPCRVFNVEWQPDGEIRTYELVERYDESYVGSIEQNDTSFLLEGALRAPGDRPDEFAFRSDQAQWVTVLVVPEYAKYPFVQAMSILGEAAKHGYDVPERVAVPHIVSGVPIPVDYDHRASFDDFDLDLEIGVDADGRSGTVRSHSRDRVDWIHVWVPKGTSLVARVRLNRAWEASVDDWWWGLTHRPSSPEYRLYVVGSTKHGTGATRFAGPYLRELR